MRLLGWLATVLGVVGVVGCLVVAVGVWVVRPPIMDKAHEIIVIGTDGLDRADELAVVAGERLTTVDSRLTTVIGTLDSVAGSPLVDTAVGNAIRDAVSGVVSGPYPELRTSVSGLRQRLDTLADVVTRLDSAIPGITLPGVVTGAVDDIDDRLTQLDDTVTSIDAIAGNGVTTSQQVQQLSTAVSDIQGVVQAVIPALGVARTQIADASAGLDRARGSVDDTVTISAGVISIVFVYLALLNVLLYQQGRRWLAREG